MSKKKLVVLSGAGVSAESGLKTFRDSDGLWEGYNIEDVATPRAWRKDPQLVLDFYKYRRKNVLDAQPNAAHHGLAELEKDFDVTIITQNIDDLHERAGSAEVLHLHGNIRLAKSSAPDAQYSETFYPIHGAELNLERDHCPQGYALRPHVVWFGEAVPAYETALQRVQAADIFIVIGSSLVVYPVAGLIHEISKHYEAYYIDPKADYLRVPAQYHLIAQTATQGMQHLFDTLHQRFLIT